MLNMPNGILRLSTGFITNVDDLNELKSVYKQAKTSGELVGILDEWCCDAECYTPEEFEMAYPHFR